MTTHDVDTLILGAGLTGLSTALHLGDDYLLLERENHVGGLTHSFEEQGHLFDITGHWLHLRIPEVEQLVHRLLGDALTQRARRARVYSHGAYTLYPFQANTHGLPDAVAAECLQGFVQARCWDRLGEDQPPALAPPKTFADFILQRLGEGIAKHFMFPYNQKLWTVHPRELDASWCDRFVPVPSVDDVILGAFGQSPQAMGYNVHFLYPKTGGIGRLPQALADALDGPVERGVAATRLRLGARQVETSDGRTIGYRQLVTSLPLNHLLAMTEDLPEPLREAAGLLRHTTITYFDVAARGANPDQPHWSYVPDPALPFYRIGSFTAVEPSMSPPDTRTFYVEISHQGPALELGDAEAKLIQQLVQMQLIDRAEDVLFIKRRTIPVAYVLPGAEVEPARQALLGHLREQRVLSTGRYGAWVYAAMEDAIWDGMEAARQVRDWRQG